MTARAGVERALARARERGDLGAFWSLDGERALAAADAFDAQGHNPRTAPLLGTPVAIKDLFDVAGLPTTAGLPGDPPPARHDAAAVRRLRAAGAIPIGKTAMDPLGTSTGGQAPGFPACLNPRDRRLSPGGSSSGSAVAIAAGIVPLGIGSDTAGSARIPAAYCGIVGFKPARGWMPGRGSVPVIPSFDAPGVLASNVDDCLRAFKALSGRDPASRPPRSALAVGLLTDLLEEAEPVVAAATIQASGRLADTGQVEVRQARLEWRADGFGMALAWELAQTWGARVDADPDRFTELIRGTVEFGREVGFVEHARVIASLSDARRGLARRFVGIDAVLCPTVPVPAPDAAEENVAVSSRFTRLFNALNWHALSLPAGRSADGRPIAVQVAAPPPRLGPLLQIARRLELALAEAG